MYFSRHFKFALVLALIINFVSSGVSAQTVTSVGDWVTAAENPETLAGALQAILAGTNAEITLDGAGPWDTDWDTWELSGAYRLFQTTVALTIGQTVTIDLGGNTLDAVSLDIVNANGKFLFENGVLGSGILNFGVGATADGNAEFTDVAFSAATLQIGGGTTTGILKQTGQTLDATTINITGYRSSLEFGGTGLTTTGLNITGGGKFHSTGGTIDIAALVVSGAGFIENNGSYTHTQSIFSGSGTLNYGGNALAVTQGGKIDLSGFTYGGFTVEAGKSVTVDGVYSHSEGATSYRSELVWYNDALLVQGGGTVAVTGGGKMSKVADITVSTGSTLTIDGAVDDTDSGGKYRSTLESTGGAMLVGGGSVEITDGGFLTGATSLTIENAGKLEISGVQSSLQAASEIEIAGAGAVTVGTAVGTGTIDLQNGGRITKAGDVVLGGDALATVTISGVGTGNNRAMLQGSGTLLIADNADANVSIGKGALLQVDGTAVIGSVAGSTGTLNIAGSGGTGNGYDATLKTGDIIFGDAGNAVVTLGTRGTMNTGAAVLAVQSGSTAEITINDTYAHSGYRSWRVGGSSTAPAELPEGAANLTVNDGTVSISGSLVMGGTGATSGIATFDGSGGGNPELEMSGGIFRNKGDSGAGADNIIFQSGAIISGGGDIVAGNQITVTSSTITPGGRWMYDFDRNDNDRMTGLGTLEFTSEMKDTNPRTTEFDGATFQTQLDRDIEASSTWDGAQRSDHALVHGQLDISGNFSINIARVLTGDYLLVKAVDSDLTTGVITGYTGHDLSSFGSDTTLLSLNGKTLVGNNRIAVANGMVSSLKNGDEIWLHVETTTGGNKVIHWTGEGNRWDMVSENFESATTAGTKQFLDGDIVIFDSGWMDNVANEPNGGGLRDIVITGEEKYFANVIIPEVRVFGTGNFSWSYDTNGKGSIIAYDSALYTTLDQQSAENGNETPSGQLVKIGTGTLTINNSNEFYGGVHLGVDGQTGGGRIIVNNSDAFGHYNSTSGFLQRGVVYVHEHSTIEIGNVDIVTGLPINMQNRFIVDPGKILTVEFNDDFWISGNDATADKGTNSVNDGKGGGIYIGNDGQVLYTSTDNYTMHIEKNIAIEGGGIYTTLGYTLAVPTEITKNIATEKGGGIYAEKEFKLRDGSDLTANATYGVGGGVYVGYEGLESLNQYFTLHGNSSIQDNIAGGKQGGGIFADGGRIVNLRSHYVPADNTDPLKPVPALYGGDIWFEGNYVNVIFDMDEPTDMDKIDKTEAERNAIHLANNVSRQEGAKLSIEGPYNTYFYDPISGDVNTTVEIMGVVATPTTALGPDAVGNTPSAADDAMIARNQAGTTVFHGDSAFYGDTTVSNGATFRLENSADYANPDNLDGATVYGRKASNDPAGDGTGRNSFTVDGDSTVTGHGTIAADTIKLDGVVDLDTGRFTRPGGGETDDPVALRDGSGSLVDTGTKRGILNLDGAVSVDGTTAHWYLNLGTGNTTDLIAVTGSAAFTGAAGQKLTLDVDEIVRGKYAIMTTTGDVTGYNTDKTKSDAPVFFDNNGSPIDLVTTTPLNAAGDPIFNRLNVATYVENKNLYLDIGARNRHVTNDGNAGGNWGHDTAWTYDASYDIVNVVDSSDWKENDLGPATTAFVDGDMVTLTGGSYTLSTHVRPVDLFVEGTNNVTITGGNGITTYSISGTDPNGTTITTVTANNDYGIIGYTGMLHKSGTSTLTFSNTGMNTFTEGIEFGKVPGDAGVISFSSVSQLVVGAAKTIDFLESGTLSYSGASAELVDLSGNGTPIRIEDGKTATFDVTNSGVVLIQSGIISDHALTDHGAVAKTGAGTLRVSGTNTFTGGTTFINGGLEIGNNTAFGTFANISSKAGVIDVTTATSKDFIVNESYTIKNRIHLAGTAGNELDIQIAADKTLTISGVVTNDITDGGAILIGTDASQLLFGGTGNLTLENNEARSGAGIYTLHTDTLVFKGTTTFRSNKATNGAGGLFTNGGVTFDDLVLENNEAGGGGGIIAIGSITISGDATISGNIVRTDGGGIDTSVGPLLDYHVIINGSATITNNVAGNHGGGIIARGNVQLDRLVSLSNNEATTDDGGGILATGTVTLGGGASNKTISANTAGNSGGAIYAWDDVSITNAASRTLTITGNEATAGDGGAIYSDGDVTITNSHTAAFTVRTNEAGDMGGAIYAGGDVSITGPVTLGGTTAQGNKAGTSGGAIYAQNISITGPATISNNAANATSGQGGAFYVDGGTLSLTTGTAGNITFSGNTASLGQAAYIAADGDIDVNAGVSGTTLRYVQFDDTLVTETTTDHTLTKTGTGMLAFTGSGNNNIFRGATNVTAGTFRITTGTSYGYNAAGTNVFTLLGDTDNDIQLTGGGTLTAGTFHLHGVVSPDSSTAVLTVADTARFGEMTFNGDVNMYGDGDDYSYQYDVHLASTGGWNSLGTSDLLTVNGDFDADTFLGKVVINLNNFGAGKFLLIDVVGGTLFVDGDPDGAVNGIGAGGAFDITIHDFLKTDRHEVKFFRGDDDISSPDGSETEPIGGNANQLWLATDYNNLYMYWTGVNTSDSGAANVWQQTNNELNGNWLDTLARGGTEYETHFESRDTAVFQDAAVGSLTPTNKTITFGSNVVVTAMIVDTTGTYSFTDTDTDTTHFGITTSATYAGDILNAEYGSSGNADQTLTKRGTGTLSFTNTGTNKFEKGIDLEGGTIRFTIGNQLTVGEISSGVAAKINVKETATLDYNGLTAGTLVTGIDIATGKILTYNVAGGVTQTQSGVITGAGALLKTGSNANSVLALTNQSNSFSGDITIQGGGRLDATNVVSLGAASNTRTIDMANNSILRITQTAASPNNVLVQQLVNAATDGGGVLQKYGIGELVIQRTDNTYANSVAANVSTSVAAGTLTGWNVGSFGTGQINIAAGATLKYDMHGAVGTAANLITGDGNLVKTQTGARYDLTLSHQSNSFTGTITVDAGTGTADNILIAANAASVNENATAAINLVTTYDRLQISQAGAGTLNRTIIGDGSFIKDGPGTLTMTGTNTFTGGTVLRIGGLTLDNVSALGTYTVAGTAKGQVDVVDPGTKTVMLNTATDTTFNNRFSIFNGTFELTNAAGRNHTIILGANSGTNGGAVAVADNTTLQLSNAGSITFAGNNDTAGANDVYLGGDDALLSITGTGNTFFGSGLRGTGTVSKSGTGTVQIAAESAFTGQTNVSAGTFRVLNNVTYGTSAATLFNQTGGSIAGAGTVSADTITIHGNISPDSATLSATKSWVATGTESFGTLTLSGTTVKLGDDGETFSMDYDLPTTDGATFGDLLKTNGATTLYGGNVNFVGMLDSGRYLVVDSNSDITIHNDKLLDGINNATGVLTATLNGNPLNKGTPRYGLAYLFGDDGTDLSEIWLDVERNTLTMDVVTDLTSVIWNTSTADYWLSQQWEAADRGFATIFNHGDYVNFKPTVDQTVAVDVGGVTVSGMVVESGRNITYTGGGILSRVQYADATTDTQITGKFLDPGEGIYTTPTVKPDGKLQKSGTGTLTFANAANTFNKGIEINAGTIAFSAANQLGTIDNDIDSTDNGITFKGTGTLQANATGQTLTNLITIEAGQTGNVYTQGNTLTLSGKITGNALTKSLPTSGTTGGVLILTNTGNDYTGLTTVSTGTLRAVGVGTLGQNTSSNIVSLALGAELEVGVATDTETLEKQITGSGGMFEKTGDGTLVLNHVNNTYSGGTTVTAGTLTAKHAVHGANTGSIGTGNVTLSAASTILNFDIEEDGSFAAQITGLGKLTKTTAGTTLTLSNVNNTYSGGTTVSAGDLIVTHAAHDANAGSLGRGGTALADGTSLTFLLDDEAGSYAYVISNVTNNTSGRVVKDGSETLTLSAANTFTGGAELAEGGLTLTDASALGKYDIDIATSGRVNVTGINTVTTLSATTGTFANHFDVGDALVWTLNATQNSMIAGFTNAGNGGAISLGTGSTMNLSNTAAVTFSSNNDDTGKNDIYLVTGASLNINGAGNVFLDSGIAGSGTVTKIAASTGITQIGETSAFNGTTGISGGTFRVVSGKTYGGTGSFSLANAATLSGGGTVQADTITINGKISPDTDTLSVTKTIVGTGPERFGTLTLSGATTFSGFTMDYDANTAKAQSSKITTANIDTGDLLRVTGSASPTITGGTINLLTSSLNPGYYLIAESDTAFGTGGSPLDGINVAGGVLKLTLNGSDLTNLSPRTLYQFDYGQNSLLVDNARIWLFADVNSLTMNWDTTDGTWNYTDANWESEQTNGGHHETKFRDGDYVYFNPVSDSEIAIAAGTRLVSGMSVGDTEDSDVTFTGDGGIRARLPKDSGETDIVGKYLPGGSGSPTLTPSGKLTKSGAGTLTFDNGSETVGNLFDQGIDIAGGTVVFHRANQIDTGTPGIRFTGIGTLQANASAVLTNNITVTTGNAGTLDTRSYNLTFQTGTVNIQNGGKLDLAGSGNQFFDKGILGTAATLTKSGTGIVQIGDDSAFNGTTTASIGTFRVIEDKQYGGTGSFTVGWTDATTFGTLAGGGKIIADTVTISGTISADSDTLSASNLLVADEHRFGTLFIEADTELLDGFRMEYDAEADSSQTPHGDLLKVTGGKTLTFAAGTINLVNTEHRLTGSYLIMEADGTILHPDDADPNQILTATLNKTDLHELSVRGTFTFYQKQDGELDPAGNQIWLDIEKNSLNMTWQETAADNIWTTTDGDENWLSTQGNPMDPPTTGIKEHVFQNGDYVHFRTISGDKSIDVVGPIIVSGFDFDAASDYTFTGTGTIDAYKTHEAIEGKYLKLADGHAEKLTPDGMLRKSGTGTLAFANGSNTFREGIEISDGTLAFTRANQLGDGGYGITFKNDATLRADDTGQNLDNKIIIEATKTATVDTQEHHLTLSGVVSGNAMTKTGTGTLSLTNIDNTYSGTTTVAAGTLRVVSNENGTALGENAVGTTHQVVLGDATELKLDVASGRVGTLRQQIVQQNSTTGGKLEKIGDGEQILTHADNTYNGGTTVTVGTLTGWYVGSFSNGTITNASALKYDLRAAGTAANRITGAGTYTKTQTGGRHDLTLSNQSNDFTGTITVDANSGTDLNRLVAINAAAINGTATAAITLVTAQDQLEIAQDVDGSLDRPLTGSGHFIKSGVGTLTVNGANSFTGGTTLSGGRIILGHETALGTHTGTGKAGQVDMTGNDTSVYSDAAAAQIVANRFVVANSLTGIELRAQNDWTIGNVAGDATGGAIVLGIGSSMTLHAFGGDMVFTDNTKTGTPNDVTMATDSTLTLSGTKNMFFAGGIDGAGAISKTGNGIVQIAGTSTFDGTTTVTGGTFRIVDSEIFGGTGSFALSADTTLAGNGTIRSTGTGNTINGIVSPDGKIFTASDTDAPTGDDRFATLTFEGDTAFGPSFMFLYDVDSPYPGSDLDAQSALTTGDLIELDGNGRYEIANGARIDLQTASTGSLEIGAYHIFRADESIALTGGATGLNDALVLYRNGETYYSTARNSAEFVYANGNKDIWLQIHANSLNMVWNVSATNNTWSATGNNGHWTSRQGNDLSNLERKEHVFRNGDYVHFVETAGAEIEIVGPVKVAGMEVSAGNGNYTFTGSGGILASKILPETVGKYLTTTVEADKLIPDGKLTKDGAGTLSFRNTGGNTFEEGIDIKAGTVSFDRADQLGTGSNGIAFDGTEADKATLRAEASALLTNNITVEAGKVGTINPQDHSLTFGTGIVAVENGGTLNLVGSGHFFFDNGVRGTAAVMNQSGTGIVQIGENSAFNGTTTVSAGTFRVIETRQYGGTGSLTISEIATLAGGGTIKADTVSVSGTISADSAVLSETKIAVSKTETERFGTLYIDADTTLQNGFRMEYDAHVDANRTPHGDLLKVIGDKTLTFGTGTINLVNTDHRLTGSYLIMEADTKILHPLDADPDRALTATLNGSFLNHNSVRGTYTFYQKDKATENVDLDGNQIWLDVEKNSLNMTWQDVTGDEVWTSTGGAENWLSTQGDYDSPTPNGVKEKIFQNGDYVHFVTLLENKEITVEGPIVVSGFDFDAATDYAFTGTGTIVSTLPTYPDGDVIEGKYLNYPDGNSWKLVPDGKLRKNGTGTLAFDNGANTFREGIDISDGILAFTRSNQLGDGGHGISFLDNATLRADATGQNLGNRILIASDKEATIDTQEHHLTLSGVVSGGSVTKTGDGRLTLTGTNTYFGITTVSAGTLEAVGVAALGVNEFDNRVFIEADAELEVYVASGSQTLHKFLTGPGVFEKTGGGELVLSQLDNDYFGGTKVSAGRLTVEYVRHGMDQGGLGTGDVEIAKDAVLNFDILEDGSYSRQISGEGKVEKSGPNTLTLSSPESSYTGETEILGGRITATHQNALGRNVAAGIVDMSGTGTSLEFMITAAAVFNQKITGQGELIQTGFGNLTLSNTNTFTGGTQWNGGDIHLTDNAGLSATTGSGKAGFVYVNTDGTLTTDTADDTIRNRFEIASNKTLSFGNEMTIADNNISGVDGGAIELKAGASFTTVSPLHLLNNTTDGNGGAVYAPTEHVVFGGTGTNTVTSLAGNSAVDGGGVYARSVSVKAQPGGSTVSGNTASGHGGAFYLLGGSVGSNAVSELDATLGSITLSGNTSSAGANAIHLNEFVTLNVRGDHNIYLVDGITSTAGAAHGNVIEIAMPTTEDMNDRALHVDGVSDYYGNTNFNTGLVRLYENARFGAIASDNVFTQSSAATLAGYGTISAKDILLGGTINAGKYTPPPRQAEIATLNFEGTAGIGTLTVGQTFMNIDINAGQTQKADLMNVLGNVKIDGDSRVDFDTFSVGKFLIVQTDGGVTGHTLGPDYYGETSITDFSTTIAGLSMNPSRFEVVYTLENGEKDIYANLKLNNNYVIWTGANDYHPADSDDWDFVGHSDYDNKWLNDPLYNWHQQDNDGFDYITRFRQGDKVAFIGDDPVELAQDDYMEVRQNIVIVPHEIDNDPASDETVARVADMLVTNAGTYRFTGAGIESYSDAHTNLEEASGQLYVTGHATAIFANAANNFQRGIVLQAGAVGFNDVSQLGTIYVDDPYNNDVTASHGIKIEGENSYGILYANADNMDLGIVINIDRATSEMVVNTGGNDFGDDTVIGNYTLTLRHAEIDGHTDPALGTPSAVNGIYGLGRLVKTGTGTLILADANSYEGGSIVEQGTLAVAADDRLGKLGTSVLLDGGTLRAMDSFATDRTIFLSENGGAVETDENKTLTHTGLLTDFDLSLGLGDLSKTGKGTFVAQNVANDFRGDLYVEEGRFFTENVQTLGFEDASRILNTKNNGGVRAVLELQVADEQTLAQQLGGDGEVLKTGTGLLNLAVDSPNFAGYLNVAAGSIYLTGDYGRGDSFRFASGTTLSGYGKLGGNIGGGVFESGSILVPGNVVADNPNENPTSKSIYVDGSVTFASGSLYRVVITQYPDPAFDPDRMRPVSDCLVVKDGTVTIDSGAELEVTIDYWAENLIPFDFGEDYSSHWTIIDATANGTANDTVERFSLHEIELPRGVEMEHGWNGSLYQLWLLGNPAGAFTDITDKHNPRQVGKVLEKLIKDPGMKELLRILSQKDLDDETIVDIMRQMAGDLRADSLAMALKMPWRQPFNRLDRDMFPFVPDPCEPIGCRRIHKRYQRQFWGEGYGRYGETRSDGNAFSHSVTRAGTVVGVDKQINMYSLFGAALNYSEPRMKQRTGRVEMKDVEIGLYNMTKLTGDYDVKTYLGYSHQRYELSRHVYIPKGNRFDALYESFDNKTSGDGFAMSVELLRGFWYNDFVKFTPLLALDYEYVWQKGYAEAGGLTALRHGSTNLERLMLRVGMNVKAEVRDRLDLFGRIQYATQLNQTEFARGNTYFVAATEPLPMDPHGVAIGRDYLNLGIGTEYFFKGTQRATSVYVNYDADFWKRQTTHTGNVGFVHRW